MFKCVYSASNPSPPSMDIKCVALLLYNWMQGRILGVSKVTAGPCDQRPLFNFDIGTYLEHGSLRIRIRVFLERFGIIIGLILKEGRFQFHHQIRMGFSSKYVFVLRLLNTYINKETFFAEDRPSSPPPPSLLSNIFIGSKFRRKKFARSMVFFYTKKFLQEILSCKKNWLKTI